MIGERTAENIKIAIGSVLEGERKEVAIRGRDLVTGLPREVVINDGDVREAIASSITTFIDGVKEVLETTPPEILSDVMNRGVYLTGGGALLRGLDVLLRKMLRIPVTIAEDPLTAVARGTGVILDDIEYYQEVLIPTDDVRAPRS